MKKEYKYSARITAGIIYLRFIERFQEHYFLSDGLVNLYRKATGTNPITASLKMIRKETGNDLKKLFKPFMTIGKDRSLNYFWMLYYENGSDEIKRLLRRNAIKYLEKRLSKFEKKNSNMLEKRFKKIKKQYKCSKSEIALIKGIYYANNFNALNEYYNFLRTEKYDVPNTLSIYSGIKENRVKNLISGRLFKDGIIKAMCDQYGYYSGDFSLNPNIEKLINKK
jgi:hypothetical protein